MAVLSDPRLDRPFMPHQQEAYGYCMANRHWALLMEMRLGKTLVAVRAAQDVTIKPVIVTAPVTVLEAWEKELELEGESYVVAHGKPNAKRQAMAVDFFQADQRAWYLVNYESLRATPELAKLPWGVAILDESTAIRNPASQISQLCTNWFNGVDHRAILTGMYAPEGPEDAFQQFKFLLGRFMGHDNFYEWRHEYFKQFGYGWWPKPGALDRIRAEVNKLAFIKTRKQVQLGSVKVYSTRNVEMNPPQRALYKQIEDGYEFDYPDGGTKETMYTIVRDNWLRRVCGGWHPDGLTLVCENKLDELMALLTTGELRNEQVVVWAKYRAELYEIDARLKAAGVSHELVMGGMLRQVRKDKLARFRAGLSRVFLCQEKVARFGVDASTADTAVYYSNEWENEDRAQSEDRIVHPMKKVPCLLLDLVTRDSIDEDVVAALQKKAFNSKWLVARFNERVGERKTKSGRRAVVAKMPSRTAR